MTKFKNCIVGYGIDKAIKIAESLFHPDSKMMTIIKYKDDFKYNSGKGIEIYNKIVSQNVELPVFTYKPKWPWSKAVGYYDGKSVYINQYVIQNLSQNEIVALLCHEAMHAHQFTHGNNYKTRDKVLHSVPYFVSENIEEFL